MDRDTVIRHYVDAGVLIDAVAEPVTERKKRVNVATPGELRSVGISLQVLIRDYSAV